MHNNPTVIMVSSPIKKYKGRQKIEIKKIEKKTSLSVAFSKRRMGLFKKASELSILCGAEIVILVQSPAKKIYAFGNPSVESVLHRYQEIEPNLAASYDDLGRRISHSRIKYLDSLKRLEDEMEIEKRMNELHELEGNTGFWWDRMDFKSMNLLYKLEESMEALERLKSIVLDRANKLKHHNKLVLYPSSSLLTNIEDDKGFDLVDLKFIEEGNFNKAVVALGSSLNVMSEKACLVDELEVDDSCLEILASEFLTNRIQSDGCDFDNLGCLINSFEVESFSNHAVAGWSSKFITNETTELVFTDSSCLENILENSASGSCSCY